MNNHLLDRIVNHPTDHTNRRANRLDIVTNINSDSDDTDSGSNSTIELEDVSAFRLDTPEVVTTVQKPKQLFFTEEDEDDVLNPEKNIGISERPKKRVRFDQAKRSESTNEQDDEIYPWELKRVIRKEFRDKLPNNYDIKRWKRPSKIMVNSITQLLETNVQNSLDQVFVRYKSELSYVTHDNEQEVGKFYRQKQSIMNDIMNKIKSQLKKSRFPSRISDRDLDIEYIVAKRKYIQKRYAKELENAERIEIELTKEQQLLKEAKDACIAIKKSNKLKLTDSLIKSNLHPCLNYAIENSYGLIKDQSKNISTKDTFKRDTNEFNLKVDRVEQPSNDLFEKIDEYLPALKGFEAVSEELGHNIEHFTKEELQLFKIKFLSK